jgi:hypothetical protein
MTEAEWQVCDQPAALLIYLRGEVSAREKAESKCSLHSGAGVLYPGSSPFIPTARFTHFGAACVSRLRELPLNEPTCRFLDAFLRHANGQATLDEVRGYLSAMNAAMVKGQRCAEDYLAFLSCETPLEAGHVSWNVSGAYAWTVSKDSVALTCAGATEDDWFEWGFSGGPPDPLYQATRKAEYREQADLLREIVGNPFRPITWNPAWQTPTVVTIAQAASEEHHLPSRPLDIERLAVLADALDDAGCASPDILGHLREPAVHVRGCWVLDLCLSRR